MKRASLALALSSLTLSAAGAASAAPKHAICADLGPTLGVGVSHFSSTGTWAETASTQYGAKWKFLYWYHVYSNNTPAQTAAYVQNALTTAKSIHAIPVFTFYHLLSLSQKHGYSGTEAQTEQKAIQDKAVMTAFFDDFITLMKTLKDEVAPVIVQVEPDAWGFMVWAFGIEGNPDAATVPVKVGGSGHPDVKGFPDHAGGLGKALLKLRDQYAPAVRLGWHASNFRTGHGGDIMASFYSKMGEWDVLFSEHPHVEGDTKQWWLPWDEAKVAQNLSFYSTLTGSAHVPIILWQEPLGTTDFHLFPSDPTMRARFAAAGIAGDLMEVQGQGNPDDFRAMDANLKTVPPPQSMAGGTAKDMRARVAAYSKSPLAWPAGSPCAAVANSGSGSSGAASSGAGSGSAVSGGGASAGSVDPGGAGGGDADEAGDPGAGSMCSVRAASPARGAGWASIAVAGAIFALRRRRRAR